MGFFELLLIAIVGLLVIGPERLPETVRTVALWVGRVKRSLRETRTELERQLGADEIRRQLHNEEIMSSLESARKSLEGGLEPERAQRLSSKDYQSNPQELPDHAHADADTAHQSPQRRRPSSPTIKSCSSCNSWQNCVTVCCAA